MLSWTRINGKRTGSLNNVIRLPQMARFYHVNDLEKAAIAASRKIDDKIMRWTSEKVGSLNVDTHLIGL